MLDNLKIHEDIAMFRESVNYTASKTGFNARLIEKDYYCSLFLAYIYSKVGKLLVFKGGTSLAKVYAGFYRLSEDLDFVIPIDIDSNRTKRRELVTDVKAAFADVSKVCRAFSILRDFKGANNSTQYFGSVAFRSLITKEKEEILFEVSLREPLHMPVKKVGAATILLDPIGQEKMIPDITVDCIDFKEAFAEKFRAALTRKEVAIRDFYDIDYAVEYLGLDVSDEQFVGVRHFSLAPYKCLCYNDLHCIKN